MTYERGEFVGGLCTAVVVYSPARAWYVVNPRSSRQSISTGTRLYMVFSTDLGRKVSLKFGTLAGKLVLLSHIKPKLQAVVPL